MKTRILRLVLIAGIIGLFTAKVCGGIVRAVDAEPANDVPLAVVVDDIALCQTSMLFPRGDQGVRVPVDVLVQCHQVIDRLDEETRALQDEGPVIVRINVYLASSAAEEQVRETLVRHFHGSRVHPALTFVTGGVAFPGISVALDAVIALEHSAVRKSVEYRRTASVDDSTSPATSVMPAGKRLYLCGRLARDKDLRLAAQDSLRRLAYTLEFAGVSKNAVVSVRAWVDPVEGMPVVARAIQEFFAGQVLPPCTLVEFRTGGGTEIEMVAYGGASSKEPEATVDYLTPLPDERSPGVYFSRLARINRGPTIFTSSLRGEPGSGLSTQLATIESKLRRVLANSGASMESLAKGTYYASGADASRRVSEFRERILNAKRSPAAAQMVVTGVGRAGCDVAIDFIAASAR